MRRTNVVVGTYCKTNVVQALAAGKKHARGQAHVYLLPRRVTYCRAGPVVLLSPRCGRPARKKSHRYDAVSGGVLLGIIV